MKRHILFLFLLLLFYIPSNAQVDSSYIGFFDNNFSVHTFLARPYLFMAHEYEENYDKTYMPNNSFDIGLGFSWNNTVISFSYGYSMDFVTDEELGDTKSFDFQYNYYGRNYTVDIFLQKYKGFYMEDDKSMGEYVLCPDLRIKQYGIYGQYVFNSNQFSYRAAFDQNEIQLKSAGSFLAGLGIYKTSIQSDESFFYNESNHLKSFQVGASTGYAYNWVINKYLSLNGSMSIGMMVGNERFDLIFRKGTEISPTAFPRMSFGYSRNNWFCGFTFHHNATFPAFKENTNISLHSGKFEIKYIWRFNSFRNPIKQ